MGFVLWELSNSAEVVKLDTTKLDRRNAMEN